MAGALAQAAPAPSSAADPYDSQDRNLPPGWGKPLLDRATEALLSDLTERAPYEAQAAAMFSNTGRATDAALGAGIGAQLKTRLGMLQLPFQLRSQAARSRLEGAEAQRAEAENEMFARNFGYMTSPWDVGGEFSRPPGGPGQEQDVTRPPAGGGGPPVAGAPASPPPAPGGSVTPTAPPQAVGGPDVNPQHLPVTDESRARLQYLGMQLHRAMRWSQTSPQARQDVGAILGQMTEVVKADPLAGEALKQREAKYGSDVDLEKQLHLKAADMGKESLAAAEEEFKALAANPNTQLDPALLRDPSQIQAWIDQRGQQIFAQRFQRLQQQAQAAGMDPHRFMGEAPVVAQPRPAPAAPQQPAAPAQAATPAVPTLPDGTPLTDEAGAPFQPRQTGPSEAVPPRPSLIPDLPALPQEQQVPLRQLAARQPPPSPFVERQLTPAERVEVNKTQEELGKSINMQAQWYGNLRDAMKLNDKSYSGPLVDVYSKLARGRAALHELFTGKESFEPTLQMTTTLNSIISTLNLQNIQAYVKGRMTNFELEYVTQLESAMDFSKQERGALFKRGLQIIGPRLRFEQARARALAAGRFIDPNSYEDWFDKSYGGRSPWDLSGADLGKGGS